VAVLDVPGRMHALPNLTTGVRRSADKCDAARWHDALDLRNAGTPVRHLSARQQFVRGPLRLQPDLQAADIPPALAPV
jgi:hypothetical protein